MIGNDIDDTFKHPMQGYYRISILEVPDGKNTVQMALPKGVTSCIFKKRNLIKIPSIDHERYCTLPGGCNTKNRTLNIILSEKEASILEDKVDSDNEVIDLLFLVELHHSIQCFIGKETLSVRGRKHLDKCYVHHATCTPDGRHCYPRITKYFASKPETRIKILKS